MSYLVLYHRDVAKDDLPGIPADQQERIRRAIEERLTTEPAKYGERLRKDLAGAWKLRVGDYRVVFDLDSTQKRVDVFVIRHRREVYTVALRRRGRRE
jgi:mRNA interferase RelE/StbE